MNIYSTDSGDSSNKSFNLTKKEIAVLTSLAQGKSYKMVAAECGVSINTIREHIRNIYHKLNVHTTIEAVLLAVKHGVLQLPIFIYLLA
jgi:DNA-binding NarL/FixJ family response regulator